MRFIQWASMLSFVAACGVESDEAAVVAQSGEGYVVEGNLPANADIDEIVADLPENGFAIVADPITGEIATVIDASSPLARDVSSEFSITAGPVCTDCGGACTAGVSTRNLQVTIQQDGGENGAAYRIETSRSRNFSSPATTPSSFTGAIGATTVLNTTGTIDNCATTFNHYFRVEAPDRAFVTSITTQGNFGGVAGGDAFCQTRANAAGLGGTWMAFIGDSTNANPNPSARFTSNGPWTQIRNSTSGTPLIVADTLADLTDGTLDASMRYSEFGILQSSTTPVWSGLGSTATSSGTDCSGWTNKTAGFQGARGVVSATNGTWLNLLNDNCGQARRLYCFEQ
jgi:hypothetical protein